MLQTAAQDRVSGKVTDTAGQPVYGASVLLDSRSWAITDSLGRFSIGNIKKTSANSRLTIRCIGYLDLVSPIRKDGIYKMQDDIMLLNEVVVTATEEHGLTTTSKIGEDAIKHIQPSSIADILELLPGGKAVDPAFGSPQIANLRAAGSLSSNYTTSALGTRFMIDGRPVGNDANLQATPAYSGLGSNYVNLGTDMRTISTEDIESVDVVRGIASVEYGDLTSGLVKINRKKGGNDIRARFKADMKSKLFYVGKGFEKSGKTLNLSLNYLDAKADPRNTRQNYNRITGSVRGGWTWASDRFRYNLGANIDYTGSFDKEKSDQDLDFGTMGPIETYKSSYNKWAAGADFSIHSKEEKSFFRSWTTTLSLTYEKDLIDRWKYVTLGIVRPLSTALDPGEHDAVAIPAKYEATMKVDGQPFYAFASSTLRFKKGIHEIKAGADWSMDKNYGGGTVFDRERPFSATMNVRPRAFSAIPAKHQVSAFAEENAKLKLGDYSLEYILGLRASLLAGPGGKYDLNGKPFLDPRGNIRIGLPYMMFAGHKLEAGIFGGAGSHVKFPTMDMLFPEPLYGDVMQLNYWPVEENLRRINVLVYRLDPTNYSLGVARNFKWETGLDARWNGFSFSVNWFREDMRSGFRSGSRPVSIVSKDYDESSIDKSTLTGPPVLEDIPYALDTNLFAYGITTNGSRTVKEGLEFTFSSKRIRAIRTKITFNGAWLITRYSNSQPEYYRPSVTLNGKNYPYIGIYNRTDSNKHTALTTNLMTDTQIPSLGLIVSASFQTTWFTDYKPSVYDLTPVAWLDKDLVSHVFTEADKNDPLLGYLVRGASALDYDYRVPFATNINLKITKTLYGDKISASVFVNKIFDITPDYHSNGTLNRRNVNPYFGMELDFKL